MAKVFARAYELSRISEGGYVNHPHDNGGPTNFGVTQRVYDAMRKRNGIPTRDVRQITQDEVKYIYLTGYWDAVSADLLPLGLDYAVFDCALTAGPRQAKIFLQRAVGVKADGVLGPVTLAAIKKQDPVATINLFCDLRLQHMKGLSDWQHFGKGWAARVNKVRDEAITLSA